MYICSTAYICYVFLTYIRLLHFTLYPFQVFLVTQYALRGCVDIRVSTNLKYTLPRTAFVSVVLIRKTILHNSKLNGDNFYDFPNSS